MSTNKKDATHGGKGSTRRPRKVDDKVFKDNWDRCFEGATLYMTLTDYKDNVYRAGYDDAIMGRVYRDRFTQQMREGAMEEHYERGWTDGRVDRDPNTRWSKYTSTKEPVGG